jgi:bacitracin synthase 3
VIDLANGEVWTSASENPEHVNQPSDLAYCIYTSGTTGKPKGVMIEHHGVTAMRQYLAELYEVDPSDKVLQFANYIFDASVWEMTISLLNGASLVLISSETAADIVRFNRYTREKGITITLLPPQCYLQTQISGLKVLTTGGSASSAEIVEKAKNNSRYINAYGPTENTVLATHWEYTGQETAKNVPIGRPIQNTRIYMLNGTRLCGIGMPGELCIAGDGVARGYLNQPELTAEKFIDNPFGEGRLYRSGDLARWLPDGNIEYLGRIDEQVKIRGFRIELGEIESGIRKIEGIKDCAVIARADANGEKAIYAYYVSDQEISISEIRDQLAKTLPDYMIPAYMAQIEKIPVTRNGKLDKRALPEIEGKSEREYIAPRNPEEEAVCAAICEILGVERVGIKDNFFELGGHSLRAMRLVNQIEEKTGTSLELREVFSHPTPEGLAACLTGGESYIPIPQAEQKSSYPMSSTQKRTYLVTQMDQAGLSYNMPAALKLKGNLDMEKLRNSFQALINRHEGLRTSFGMEEGELRLSSSGSMNSVLKCL